MYLLVFLGDNFISKFVVSVKNHRKNYETALFKVWIVEHDICRKEGRKNEVEVVEVVVEVDEVDEVDEVHEDDEVQNSAK